MLSKFKSEYALIRRPWFVYATTCLILFSAGFYSYRAINISANKEVVMAMLEKVNPTGERSKFILSDSSVVYLGAESCLKFPEKFGAGNREVFLTGEAFFEIARDKKHPFIIHTGSIQTKALGTSFKINAFEGKHLTISVATGKVCVDHEMTGTDALQSLAVLNPGQEVNWNHHTQTAAINLVDTTSVQEWKDGTMTFVAASIGDIAEELERWYNVKINFKDNGIRNYPISLIVKGTDPLRHTLDVICEATHLQYKMSGHTITLVK